VSSSGVSASAAVEISTPFVSAMRLNEWREPSAFTRPADATVCRSASIVRGATIEVAVYARLPAQFRSMLAFSRAAGSSRPGGAPPASARARR